MAIEVLPTDEAFDISPDAGDPLCICSRCKVKITSNQLPIICLTVNDEGDVDENSKEYRYCEKCQQAIGIIMFSQPEELFDPNWTVDDQK